MGELHLFGGFHADELQTVLQHDAGLVCQLQTGSLNSRVLALDAAGVVETVEAGSQLLQAAVDVAGVIVAGSQLDLLAELGDLLDQGDLGLAAQHAHVHVGLCGQSSGSGLHVGVHSGAEQVAGLLHDVDGVHDSLGSQTVGNSVSTTLTDEDVGLDIFLKGNLHELCTNYIQYKATNKEKIIGIIIEYAKKNPENLIRFQLESYIRACGTRVSRRPLHKIMESLVKKGYLEHNDGYHTGYRVIDLDKFIDAYNSGVVIDEAPRIKHNIVTLELINKICAWVRTTRKVKRLF